MSYSYIYNYMYIYIKLEVFGDGQLLNIWVVKFYWGKIYMFIHIEFVAWSLSINSLARTNVYWFLAKLGKSMHKLSWQWETHDFELNCIDILCMLYCYTRGYLTTSFVIGTWEQYAAGDYYGLIWMGLQLTIPNSDFMEMSCWGQNQNPEKITSQGNMPTVSISITGVPWPPVSHSVTEVYRCPKLSWQRLPGTRRMTSPCFLWNWADARHVTQPVNTGEMFGRKFEVGNLSPNLSTSAYSLWKLEIQKIRQDSRSGNPASKCPTNSGW